MLPADRIRLQHMLEAAQEATAFIQGQSPSMLATSRLLIMGVVRCIEIVGEAATHVTQACQDAHPQIPWAPIIAMRNRLIHAYFDVDLDRVWDTVHDDLPPLIQQLQQLLTPEK